jgi:hypothetical protein
MGVRDMQTSFLRREGDYFSGLKVVHGLVLYAMSIIDEGHGDNAPVLLPHGKRQAL